MASGTVYVMPTDPDRQKLSHMVELGGPPDGWLKDGNFRLATAGEIAQMREDSFRDTVAE